MYPASDAREFDHVRLTFFFEGRTSDVNYYIARFQVSPFFERFNGLFDSLVDVVDFFTMVGVHTPNERHFAD